MGIGNLDASMPPHVKGSFLFFCLYTTEIILLKIFLFFYLPLFNSVAHKKNFFGRENIGWAFASPLAPPSKLSLCFQIFTYSMQKFPWGVKH
jgi:hypothetical protein